MHADVIKKNLKKASMKRKQSPKASSKAIKPKDQPVPPGTILPTRQVNYGGGD